MANPFSRKVFIVHGHDEAAKLAVARFLEFLDLKPIILHEQIDLNQTVIEKLETNSDVAFAIVVLSPDDLGAVVTAPGHLMPRARQNVVFELGYFVGKLGRKNVCVINKGKVEFASFSDYSGILCTEMDIGGGWKSKLAREINGAGIVVNMAKVATAP